MNILSFANNKVVNHYISMNEVNIFQLSLLI